MQRGSYVTAVVFVAGIEKFAASSRDGVVTMGEVETGKLTHTPTDSSGVLSLTYSEESSAVISGSVTGLFGVHFLYSPDRLGTMPGFAAKLGDDPIGIARMIFTPDERLILLLSTQGEAKLVRLSNGAPLEQLNGRRDIAGAAFLPNANTLATGSADGVVKMWALAKPESVRSNSDNSRIDRLVANNGIFLEMVSGVMAIRHYGEDKPLQTLKAAEHFGMMSPDGSIMITTTDDGMCILAVGTGQPCRQITPPGESHEIDEIKFAPYGEKFPQKKFAVLKDGGDLVEIWSADGETPIVNLQDKHVSYDFLLSADGEYLLDYGSYDDVRLIHVSDGVETKIPKQPPITAAVFSPDGVHYAMGFENGGVQLWRVGDDKPTQVFSGHAKSVESLTFDKTGELLLSGGQDGVARLWRADEQESLEHFESVDNDIAMAGFDADGEHVLLLDDGGLSRWTISPAVRGVASKQVELACKRLDQLGVVAFTPDDRLRFPILKGVKDSPCEELGLIKPRPKPAVAPPVAAPPAKPEAAAPAKPSGG